MCAIICVLDFLVSSLWCHNHGIRINVQIITCPPLLGPCALFYFFVTIDLKFIIKILLCKETKVASPVFIKTSKKSLGSVKCLDQKRPFILNTVWSFGAHASISLWAQNLTKTREIKKCPSLEIFLIYFIHLPSSRLHGFNI